MSAGYPSTEEIWQQSRDSINLVAGGILGGYLGLSISRSGLTRGDALDLFMLIVLTAFASQQIVTFGNRWFFGNKKLAALFLGFSLISVWISFAAARNLGLDVPIFRTIYAAWFFLIVTQVGAFEVSELMKRARDD